jgi:hypothetical protein
MMNPQAKREQAMYINIFYDLGFHGRWKDANGNKMLSAPEEEILKILRMIETDPIYRIKINSDCSVETTAYDLMDKFKPELDGHYESLDNLPKWVQDRLSVLMLLDHNNINHMIDKVGRRISEEIFWVVKGEPSGDDPRG